MQLDKRVLSLLNEDLEGGVQPFACRVENGLTVCTIQYGPVAQLSLLTSYGSSCLQCGVHTGLYNTLS